MIAARARAGAAGEARAGIVAAVARNLRALAGLRPVRLGGGALSARVRSLGSGAVSC